MTKIKINLTSGNVIEKPLVTCFRGSNGDYLVLDNETNGSMGLPIICISRFTGSGAEKIFDQVEWTSVKENLKSIIAGNSLPYLKVPEVLNAQDDFFTQLTLPVASFDLLKNVYQPPVEVAPVQAAPVESVPAVEMPMPEVPVAPVVPMMEPVMTVSPAPVVDMPVVEPVAPVMPTVEPMAPVFNEPVPVTPTPVMPTFDLNPVASAPVMPSAEPVMPMMEPLAPVFNEPAPTVEVTTPVMPEIDPVAAPMPASTISDADIQAIKDNFMKSCETMFDALVKKFQNK